MLKPFRAVVVGILAAVVGVVGTAQAIPYGLDFVLAKPDGKWQVHVEGFQSGDSAAVTLKCADKPDSELGKVTAEADGTIDQFYTLPDGTDVKTCTMQVKGGSIDRTFTLNLPATGSSTTGTLAVAMTFVLIGGVIVGAGALGKRRARLIA